MTLDREAMVSDLWDALNRRDREAAAALLHPNVDYANLIDGGRCLGREAVLDYWRRASAGMKYEATPLAYETRPDGRLAVTIQHTVRRLDGRLWTEGSILHLFTFSDGLISRMDAE